MKKYILSAYIVSTLVMSFTQYIKSMDQNDPMRKIMRNEWVSITDVRDALNRGADPEDHLLYLALVHKRLDLADVLFDHGTRFIDIMAGEIIRNAAIDIKLKRKTPRELYSIVSWILNHGITIGITNSQALLYAIIHLSREDNKIAPIQSLRVALIGLVTSTDRVVITEPLLRMLVVADEETVTRDFDRYAQTETVAPALINDAVIMASARGFRSIITRLLSDFKEIIQQDTLQSAFITAAIANNVDIATMLLKHVDLILERDEWTSTFGEALVLAAAYGNSNIINLILEPRETEEHAGEGSSSGFLAHFNTAGVRTDTINPLYVQRAIEIATRNGHFEIAQSLVRSIQDGYLRTGTKTWNNTLTRVLMFAALRGGLDNLKFFTHTLLTALENNWSFDNPRIITYLTALLKRKYLRPEMRTLLERALTMIHNTKEARQAQRSMQQNTSYFHRIPVELLSNMLLAILTSSIQHSRGKHS